MDQVEHTPPLHLMLVRTSNQLGQVGVILVDPGPGLLPHEVMRRGQQEQEEDISGGISMEI